MTRGGDFQVEQCQLRHISEQRIVEHLMAEKQRIAADPNLDAITKAALMHDNNAALASHKDAAKKAAAGVRNHGGQLVPLAAVTPAMENSLRVAFTLRVIHLVQSGIAMQAATALQYRHYPNDKTLYLAINTSLSHQQRDNRKNIALLNTLVPDMSADIRGLLQPHLPLDLEKLQQNPVLFAIMQMTHAAPAAAVGGVAAAPVVPAARVPPNLCALFNATRVLARAMRARQLCNTVVNDMRVMLQRQLESVRRALYCAQKLRGHVARGEQVRFGLACTGPRSEAPPPATGRYSSCFASPLSLTSAKGLAALLQAEAVSCAHRFEAAFVAFVEKPWPAPFQAAQQQMRVVWGPVRDELRARGLVGGAVQLQNGAPAPPGGQADGNGTGTGDDDDDDSGEDDQT